MYVFLMDVMMLVTAEAVGMVVIMRMLVMMAS
jgi:hypothetical protein